MKILLSVCSARPNFVKLAAIHHAWKNGFTADFRHIIVHTGQHYDALLSDVFFDQLDIPKPDHNLGVKGGDRDEVLAKTEAAMIPLFHTLRPDCVLVYGDVNGALGAARAAQKTGTSIAHVEAGLRSFDQTMPEELNRIEIDGLADLLFVSEQAGMENLKMEGCKGRAAFVGNTMIDTLIRMQPLISTQSVPFDVPDIFAIATMHRPSNVDHADALGRVLRLLDDVSAHLPIILPLHHRARASIDRFGLQSLIASRIQMVDSLGYLPFLHLLSRSACILTDSGGIQEEAVLLRKRCFTLRRNTERPSTIASGSNVLIDPQDDTDRTTVLDFARHPRDPAVLIPEMWDGSTGQRILGILRDVL